jgi:hypothetical protein
LPYGFMPINVVRRLFHQCRTSNERNTPNRSQPTDGQSLALLLSPRTRH